MIPAGLELDLVACLPELILTAGLLVLLILSLLFRERRGQVMAIGGSLLLLAAAIVSLSGDERVGAYLFGSVVQDGVTLFFRVFFCCGTILCLWLLLPSFRKDAEPFLLMISGVLGMFLLAGANDLVTLFVALELVSIPSYVLAGYRRLDVRSGEAALKYILYGALSSGLMIYGMAFLYGLTSTTMLPEIAAKLSTAPNQQSMLLIALILVLAGIGYKIAMVPFHFWCPDVYEGSPTAVTAFLSVLPKAAGLAALYRMIPVFQTLDTSYGVSALLIVSIASAVTMTFGNLGAIWQTSLKRLLAYSSIAHAGYILMGFAVLAGIGEVDLYWQTSEAIFFYLVTYLFMNLGAFLIVDWVERHKGGEGIERFRGLGRTDPIPAILLAVFLFSLTGIPPLAGFIGKFLLFAALVKAKMFALAVIAIANTVVSLYYYVRVIRAMFLDDPAPEIVVPGSGFRWGSVVGILSLATVIPTLILGVWWGPLFEWIHLRTW
ncbi:NADH-quinone oxidoreductase subunit N [candidate division KSB1 bacterium]|nr:MAG: NADH-quinone oxidoreductase subunit N [candidate division KSB1 bacterium]